MSRHLGGRSLRSTRSAAVVGASALALVACESLIGANFDRTARPNDAASSADASNDDGGGMGDAHFEIVQGQPAGETLLAIWGAGPREVFAVGSNGIHVDYYGGKWRTVGAHRGGRDLFAVWGTSARDVYAVGVQRSDNRGVIQHFDGDSWGDEYLADTPLYGVWGAEGAVLAVGAKGMLYGKANSGEWAPRLSNGLPTNPNVPSKPDSPILWSISGNNPTNFAIAADVDRIFHYVGKGDFMTLDPKLDRTVAFRTAFGLPGDETDIFFGSNYFGITWLAAPTVAPIDRFDAGARDGQLLRLYEDRTSAGAAELYIRGIWGNATKKIFVGDEGRILTYEAGSNDVMRLESPTTSSLNGVWGSSPEDIWIVGERELILHGSLPH